MNEKTENLNAFDLLSPSIKEKLALLNITEPTKVQQKLIPQILQNQNEKQDNAVF